MTGYKQWCRSVVKLVWVRVSQVKPSNCFRRLEKLVLPSILTHVLHPSWCETCRVIQAQLWIIECDILWVWKHTLTPPTYIQGVRTPTSRTCPWLQNCYHIYICNMILLCFWCLTEVHAYPPQKQYEPDLPEYMWLFLTACRRSSSSCFQQRYIVFYFACRVCAIY